MLVRHNVEKKSAGFDTETTCGTTALAQDHFADRLLQVAFMMQIGTNVVAPVLASDFHHFIAFLLVRGRTHPRLLVFRVRVSVRIFVDSHGDHKSGARGVALAHTLAREAGQVAIVHGIPRVAIFLHEDTTRDLSQQTTVTLIDETSERNSQEAIASALTAAAATVVQVARGANVAGDRGADLNSRATHSIVSRREGTLMRATTATIAIFSDPIRTRIGSAIVVGDAREFGQHLCTLFASNLLWIFRWKRACFTTTVNSFSLFAKVKG